MSLKNFMVVSLFFICKNNNGMEIENDEKVYLSSSSESESNKIIIYSEGAEGAEGGEQDFEMECDLTPSSQSPVSEEALQNKKITKNYMLEKNAFFKHIVDTNNLKRSILNYLANMKEEDLNNYLSGSCKIAIDINADMRKKFDVMRVCQEKNWQKIIEDLKNALKKGEINLKNFKNIDNFNDEVIDWKVIQAKVYEYIKNNKLIGIDPNQAAMVFKGRSNAMKGLLAEIVPLVFNNIDQQQKNVLYVRFKNSVKQYILENYPSWVESNNNSLQNEEVLLLEQKTIGAQKKSLFGDNNQNIIDLAYVWLLVKKEIKGIVENNRNVRLDRKKIVENMKEFFFNKLRENTIIVLYKIDSVALDKKIRSLLKRVVKKKNRENKNKDKNKDKKKAKHQLVFGCDKELERIFEKIKLPAFYDDVYASLKRVLPKRCVGAFKELIQRYQQIVSLGEKGENTILRKNTLIINETYRKIAKELLLKKDEMQKTIIGENNKGDCYSAERSDCGSVEGFVEEYLKKNKEEISMSEEEKINQ